MNETTRDSEIERDEGQRRKEEKRNQTEGEMSGSCSVQDHLSHSGLENTLHSSPSSSSINGVHDSTPLGSKPDQLLQDLLALAVDASACLEDHRQKVAL